MQSRSRICRVSESSSEIPAIFSKTSERGGTRIRRRITHSKLEFEDCRRSGPSSWPVGVKRTKNWSAYSANTFKRRGTLQPSPRSDLYEVEIVYEIPCRPHIQVVTPRLTTWGDLKRQPHTFRDGSLCVHQAHEWHGNKLIAETIIPWTCLWLAFYETWLATGCWLGEGTHPDLPEHSPFGEIVGAAA